MSESDDEDVLYAPTGKHLNHQGKGLLGNGVKNVNDILNGPSENRRLKKTIALCGAFAGLGLALSVVGPTLQELRTHLNVSLPTISYIFTGRSIGYVLGSILGGVTFEYFHPLLLIAITLAMSGIGLLVTPYCEHMMSSVIAMSFVGIAMGALDTGANVVCLRMWGKRSAPFMQALHFSFALGAFIAPLLAGPFLGQLTPTHLAINSSNDIMSPTSQVPTSVLSSISSSPTTTVLTTTLNSTVLEQIKANNESEAIKSDENPTVLTTTLNSTVLEQIKANNESEAIKSDENPSKPKTSPIPTTPSTTTNEDAHKIKQPATADPKSKETSTISSLAAKKLTTIITTEMSTEISTTIDDSTTSITTTPSKATAIPPVQKTTPDATQDENKSRKKEKESEAEGSGTSKRDTESVKARQSTNILQSNAKDASSEYGAKYSRSSRRLLGQDKTDEQRSGQKLTFHSEDDGHFVKRKQKNKHWRSRIMLSVDNLKEQNKDKDPKGEDAENEDAENEDAEKHAENEDAEKQAEDEDAEKQAEDEDAEKQTEDEDAEKQTEDEDEDPQKTVAAEATAGPKNIPKERFKYPYIIISVFLILMSLVFAFFFCTSPAKMKSTGAPNMEGSISSNPSEKNFTSYILLLLFIFYFLYVGAEVGYGGFIYTFAVDGKTIDFTSTNATQLNSLFWGTFAFGRGISICIASVLSPLNMLVLDIAGCIVSSLALAYQGDTNATVLWIGTATLGLSMASLFPSGISWLESHATMTGNMASFLIVGAAFGEMAVPILLGYLFSSDIGPISLMYVMAGVSILTAFIFGVTVYLAHNEGRNYDPLPKEDVLEDIITGVQSAIEPEDIPFQTFGSKQMSKPFLPKPLQKKKHVE